MSSICGKNIIISIFGQSHSESIGVIIDGLPSGFQIDMDKLYAFMERRAPGRNEHSTKRREADKPEFLSGLVAGVTCGAPICAVIKNGDTRPGDYDKLRDVPRPGHADFTAFVKYGASHDIRGGGHFSGRLTAPMCVAGGIIIQLLEREGIELAARIVSIGEVSDEPFDTVNTTLESLRKIKSAAFPVSSEKRGDEMRAAVECARVDGDSLGGVIECVVLGLPAGLGEPMFDGMENKISGIVFGIPAVRGVEFGGGFGSARMRGSENNDEFYMDGKTVKTRTNNHGGILGGITTGMPLVFRAAIKPTPSIAKEQDSVCLSRGENVKLTVSGRHDPCIVPRAVPCIEAAAAIAVFDQMAPAFKGFL